jgi:DNA-binding NarL/FixJ family response regulator
MPDMNGHQFAYEIRRLKPETPVVMFSGSEIPEETRQLVDAIVPKADAHKTLLPTVSRLCDGSMSS